MYSLQNLVTQDTTDVYVKHLRACLFNENTLTPLQAAVTDTLAKFVAESVVKMKGSSHESRTKHSFLIRWGGYGEEDDTWEPWDCCRDSYAVQIFLSQHSNARIRKLTKPDFGASWLSKIYAKRFTHAQCYGS